MPELPEVEIVKQSLDKNIKFKKIKKVPKFGDLYPFFTP